MTPTCANTASEHGYKGCEEITRQDKGLRNSRKLSEVVKKLVLSKIKYIITLLKK